MDNQFVQHVSVPRVIT